MRKPQKNVPCFLLGLVIFASFSSAVAWNSSYTYAQQLTITNPNATLALTQNNFTTNFTFNSASLITAGKLQADCKDLSIGYGSGIVTDVNRFVVDCNTANTQVLFALQNGIAASGSDNNYYLQYGSNLSLSPLANASKVFAFYDNFDDNILSEAWSCDAGTCTETGQEMVFSGVESRLKNVLKYGKTATSGDIYTHLKLDLVIYDTNINFEFGFQPGETNATLLRDNGNGLQIHNSSGVVGATTITSPNGTSQKFSITLDGAKATATNHYVGNTAVFDLNGDPRQADMWLGVYGWAGVATHFDNFTVMGFLSNPPTVASGGEVGAGGVPFAVSVLSPVNESWSNNPYLNVSYRVDSAYTPFTQIDLIYNGSTTSNTSNVLNNTPASFNVSSSDGDYYFNVTAFYTLPLSNASANYLRKIDTTAPTVTLNSPSNNYVLNNASGDAAQFYFTISDARSVKNVSFYHNATGSFVLNQSNTTNVDNNTLASLNRTNLAELQIVWNIYACDEASNCAFAASNRTLTINRSAPTLIFNTENSATLLNQTPGNNWAFLNVSTNGETVSSAWARFCTTSSCTNYTLTNNDGRNFWQNITGLTANTTQLYSVFINNTAGNSTYTSNRSIRTTNVPWSIEDSLNDATIGFGANAELSARICDTVNVSYVIFEHNATTADYTMQNETAESWTAALSGGCGTLSKTFSGWGTQYSNRVFGWKVHYNNTAGNWNTTETAYITVTGGQQLGGGGGGGGGGLAAISTSPSPLVTPSPRVSEFEDTVSAYIMMQVAELKKNKDFISSFFATVLSAVADYRGFVVGSTPIGGANIPNVVFPLMVASSMAYVAAPIRRYGGSEEVDFGASNISLSFLLIAVFTILLSFGGIK